MIEIKVGPELDRAVAEAIGWFLRTDGIFEDSWHSAARAEWPIRDFKPSTDLNAAFSAAEVVGLFSGMSSWRTLGMNDLRGAWSMFEQDGYVKSSSVGDHHATPALALCAAILKLKETSDDGRAERMDAAGG